MIQLTYWKDAIDKNDPEDYDEILSVRLKSVKEIPQLLAHMPRNCKMVSTEHPPRKLKSGKVTIFFKQIWVKGEPLSFKEKCCPLCKREL